MHEHMHMHEHITPHMQARGFCAKVPPTNHASK